jgi:carbon storage regulator
MLVLSRKKEESIVISRLGQDEDIEIKVVEVSGSQVRLGIAAPEEYKILRKELLSGA